MNLLRERERLLRYVKHQLDIFDYYPDNFIFDGEYLAPRGVVVACNQTVFDRLVAYAEHYCPNMKITSMTIEECMQRGVE